MGLRERMAGTKMRQLRVILDLGSAIWRIHVHYTRINSHRKFTRHGYEVPVLSTWSQDLSVSWS